MGLATAELSIPQVPSLFADPLFMQIRCCYADPALFMQMKALFTQILSLFTQIPSCLCRLYPCLHRPRPCSPTLSLFTLTPTLFNSIPALFTQAPIPATEPLAVCRALTAWDKQARELLSVSLALMGPQVNLPCPELSPCCQGWVVLEAPSQNRAEAAASSFKAVALPLTSTKRSTTCS